MYKKTTQVHHVSAEDLTRIILDGVEKKINAFEERLISKEPLEFMDRKETAEFLGVSLATIHVWSQKGILKPYKISERIRFKREDIIATLERSRES